MRIVVAAVVLALFGSVASAGLKCAKLPRLVFYSETADVHDDGTWHRTKPRAKTDAREVEQQGMLDDAALDKFRVYVSALRQPTESAAERRVQEGKMIACLDALIASPRGATATKACAVPKPKT